MLAASFWGDFGDYRSCQYIKLILFLSQLTELPLRAFFPRRQKSISSDFTFREIGVRRKLGRVRLDVLCHLSPSEREWSLEKWDETDCERRRRDCGRPREDIKVEEVVGVEEVVEG